MEKLNNKESTFLIIMLILNVIVLITSQIVVEHCSSSSLINAIYISVIAILITWTMCILFKKFPGMDILDISYFLGGNFLKFLVGITFFIYFLFLIIILMCRIVDCLQVVYYSSTSPIYIYLMLVISAGILCSFKNNAITKSNVIFLPLTLLTIALIFIGNYKNFNFYNIYPILGNGVKSTFLSGLTNLFSFSGISILYFLPTKMKNPDKFMKVSLISVAISTMFFLICIAIVLFMFNNKLIDSQLFPIYQSVRYIEFGTFFQRLDSAFLLFRIIAFIGFLSANSVVCLDIFQSIFKLSDKKPITFPLELLIFSLTLFVRSQFNLELFDNFIFKILFFTIVIGLGFSILIFSNIKYYKRHFSTKKEGF